VGDLAALDFWHGISGLAGRFKLDARLQPGKQGQGLELSAEARGLGAELVRRDDAVAALSGHIELQGSQTSGSLDGQVSVTQAEIRIPDRFGPDVPELDVIEVHDGDADMPERPPRQPPYALQLDMQVDIPGRTFVRGRGMESQ